MKTRTKKPEKEGVMWITPGMNHDYDPEGQRPLISSDDCLCRGLVEKRLVLAVEPMPTSRWGINYRNHIGIIKWDLLRKEIVKAHDGKCDFCDAILNLHCHEVWHYDMKTGVQRLDDIEVCCNMCHLVKHLGNAHRLARLGQVDIKSVYDHFCKVNGCSMDILGLHNMEVNEIKRNMERIKWTTDMEGWGDGIHTKS